MVRCFGGSTCAAAGHIDQSSPENATPHRPSERESCAGAILLLLEWMYLRVLSAFTRHPLWSPRAGSSVGSDTRPVGPSAASWARRPAGRSPSREAQILLGEARAESMTRQFAAPAKHATTLPSLAISARPGK